MITLEDMQLNGCIDGQVRGSELVHNGGWYDVTGKKIGWGDLSFEDLKQLSEKLPVDKVLLVLSEQDSYWNFVEEINLDNVSPTGFSHDVNEKEKNPEKEYVWEHIYWAVFDGKMYRVDKYNETPPVEKIYKDSTYTQISKETMVALLSGQS